MTAVTVYDAWEYIKERKPFEAGRGSFRGIPFSVRGTGDLPSDIAVAYNGMLGRVRYTVMSYRTPIAWYTTDDVWHVPDRRYSVTTSNHQYVVLRALSGHARVEGYGPAARAVPPDHYGSRRNGW